MERTLCILKPDATQRGLQQEILDLLRHQGFDILAQKDLHLTLSQAKAFYHVHEKRPFYNDLCAFMSSGPVVVCILKARSAVKKYRDFMGATDPAQAAEGTLRARYGMSIDHNTVHGSDSLATADEEIGFFFAPYELIA